MQPKFGLAWRSLSSLATLWGAAAAMGGLFAWSLEDRYKRGRAGEKQKVRPPRHINRGQRFASVGTCLGGTTVISYCKVRDVAQSRR
ncbi:hypothetical protein BDP81DRAFT_438639 [Colletotrichum phormii]|uniref:Uncharacterized protein n=1 Tax=Colletotrichum phormii TaxID=359342 RepID=A0AAJ0E9L0_9PEZI|nr:uncharacterized protein BDP81DRAFT_438639 [Colletotrichum phormii]KAK1624089.1 hypothetical protein BDP81DRAFT_438639 [Colletotrichum phormii]